MVKISNKTRNRRKKRVELSKTERFVRKVTNRLFGFLRIFPFSYIILDIAFAREISISVEFYFLMVYLTALFLALFIGFGLWNNFIIYNIRDNKNKKSSILTWLGRIAFFIIIVIDINIFVLPMTLDIPRIVTRNYKEINGTVKSIETNDYARERSSGRGRWNEKIKYIYFTEETSGKTIKITFHARNNKADIGYNVNTIDYLPHSKWGVNAK